jgi:hypothetical protein
MRRPPFNSENKATSIGSTFKNPEAPAVRREVGADDYPVMALMCGKAEWTDAA